MFSFFHWCAAWRRESGVSMDLSSPWILRATRDLRIALPPIVMMSCTYSFAIPAIAMVSFRCAL